MNIDDLIRGYANELRSAHARQVAPGLDPRKTRRNWVVVLGAAAVVLLLITPVALLLRSDPEVRPAQQPAPTTVPASLPETTLPGGTTAMLAEVPATSLADVPTTVVAKPTLPEPVGDWERISTDPRLFGPGAITGGANDDARIVLAGCEGFVRDAPGLPIWWSDDALTWQRAEGPDDVECLTFVEATPFGFFAGGAGSSLWSADGVQWESLDLADGFGLEEPGQLGWVQAVFLSPTDDRVTLLYSRASFGESTVATLATTTDGEIWSLGPAESAALFDTSDVEDVIEGGDGLLAVGQSPGGQSVPTAAVFTSVDGLSWRRVTPQNVDFDEKVMRSVLRVGDQFVAVGGDYSDTRLMTAWTSPDGITWTRSPRPDDPVAAEFGSMTAEAITTEGGKIWAAGRDFDAARDREQTLPAIWSSEDGRLWSRVDIEEVRGTIPFTVVDTGDLRIGVWPPTPRGEFDDAIQIFRAN